MTQDKDVEAVKRAADKQAGRIAEVDKGINAGLDAQQFVSNLPECQCDSPEPDKMGPPAVCLACGKRVGAQASMRIIKRNTATLDPGRLLAEPSEPWAPMPGNIIEIAQDTEYSAVTPPHYQRGPRVAMQDYDTAEYYDIQAIDVMRAIQDPRLATAFKYIWRVAFGGKQEPWDSRTPEEVDSRDISSAVWYLQDYLTNPPSRLAPGSTGAYTPGAVGQPETKD